MSENTALESRYPLWFGQEFGFVGSTDEKGAITESVNAVLGELTKKSAAERPVLKDDGNLKLADLGCAAGVLGKMVGDIACEKTGRKIDYLGVDVNENMDAPVRANVTGTAFNQANFQSGSAEKLAEFRPDIILASHIYYYPDNAVHNPKVNSTSPNSPLHKSLIDTVGSMKKDSLALIAHESASDFDPIKRKYGAHTEADTAERLERMLRPSVSSAANALSFKTHIYFPDLSDAQWERMKQAENYDVNTNPYGDEKKLLNARILAEFMIHKPLENMPEADRNQYVDDLKAIVNKAPIVSEGKFAEKFGPVHEMTNENQLIVRTHHENKAAGEYVRQAVNQLSGRGLAA